MRVYQIEINIVHSIYYYDYDSLLSNHRSCPIERSVNIPFPFEYIANIEVSET
jgi:hypothetical protein